MKTLQPGDTVPSFTAVDQDENIVSSSDLTGKKVSYFFIQGLIHLVVQPRPVILGIIIKFCMTRATNCSV